MSENQRALELAARVDDAESQAKALVGLARAKQGLGQNERPWAHAIDVLTIVQRSRQHRLEAEARATIAEIQRSHGA